MDHRIQISRDNVSLKALRNREDLDYENQGNPLVVNVDVTQKAVHLPANVILIRIDPSYPSHIV